MGNYRIVSGRTMRRKEAQLGEAATNVAQTSSLLYRGFPTCQPQEVGHPADWKSAIQQVGNLRYPRAMEAHLPTSPQDQSRAHII
jgi:hypothetical protein